MISAARRNQLLLIVGSLGFAWFAMQAVHELGHVLVARLTGGSVQRVILHPLAISRTDVDPNPCPLLVAWGGPVLGIAWPLIVAVLFRCWKRSFLLTFFAGFCLIANGLYLGLGWIDRVGDAGDLLRHGAAVWQLALFGAVTTSAGLWLWHIAAPDFGFGANPRTIEVGSVRLVWFAWLIVLLGGLLISGFSQS